MRRTFSSSTSRPPASIPSRATASGRSWPSFSRKDNVTIFVSTHFMNEAERCDRISLMHAGKVLTSDTPAAIVAAHGTATLEDGLHRLPGRGDRRHRGARPDRLRSDRRRPRTLRRFHASTARDSIPRACSPIPGAKRSSCGAIRSAPRSRSSAACCCCSCSATASAWTSRI